MMFHRSKLRQMRSVNVKVFDNSGFFVFMKSQYLSHEVSLNHLHKVLYRVG